MAGLYCISHEFHFATYSRVMRAAACQTEHAVLPAGWSVYHENLVRRLFLQCMSGLLKGYHMFLPQSSATSNKPGGAGVDWYTHVYQACCEATTFFCPRAAPPLTSLVAQVQDQCSNGKMATTSCLQVDVMVAGLMFCHAKYFCCEP